jgi:hypothetical protein
MRGALISHLILSSPKLDNFNWRDCIVKRLILASSALTVCLTMLSPTAIAGEVGAASTDNANIPEIKPFNLVHRAYSGDFTEEGIPGFNRLGRAYQSGEIQAEDLVATAIDQGRLSEDTLNDQGYLNAVEFQLRNLRMQPVHSNDDDD